MAGCCGSLVYDPCSQFFDIRAYRPVQACICNPISNANLVEMCDKVLMHADALVSRLHANGFRSSLQIQHRNLISNMCTRPRGSSRQLSVEFTVRICRLNFLVFVC